MAQFSLNDYGMSAQALALEHESRGQHPEYTRELYEGAQLRSRSDLPDYWVWVESKLSEEHEALNEELSLAGIALTL